MKSIDLNKVAKDEPDIFSYTDYRLYLKDCLETMKAQKRGISYRSLAAKCGFTSSGHLKMVIDGKRNLTVATLPPVCRVFQISGKRKQYFEILVFFNQAKSESERKSYLERLSELKRSGVKLTQLERFRYEYFTQPHYVAVRELAWLPDFQADPQWIADRLAPLVTVHMAHKALEVLFRLDLLKKDAGGRVRPHAATLSTPEDVTALEIFRYHDEVLALTKAALYQRHGDTRDFSGLTIPYKKSHLPEIRKRIFEFRESIINLINETPGPYEGVYQINIQGFPLTRF